MLKYVFIVAKIHMSPEFKQILIILLYFVIIKATRCTKFSNLFWNETLCVTYRSFVHNQEFFTVHTAMVYVTQVCRQLLSRIRVEHSDPVQKLSANLNDIPLL
jgi:hypothetical protein